MTLIKVFSDQIYFIDLAPLFNLADVILGERALLWKFNKACAMCLVLTTGPIFCLLLGVSSDYAQPITGQVTQVTCPVIGQAEPELTLSKRQKTGPGLSWITAFITWTHLGPEWNGCMAFSKWDFRIDVLRENLYIMIMVVLLTKKMILTQVMVCVALLVYQSISLTNVDQVLGQCMASPRIKELIG